MTFQPVDRKTFLQRLRRSQLLSAEEIGRLLPRLPETACGKGVARALVERGELTRFQAERLLAGRTAGFVLGQYRILDMIGRGGTGRVYKAEHRALKRLVAIKVLAPALLRNERAVDLFLREVRAASQLIHPHIVTAYDAHVAEGRHYLVLELVDGPNLEQLVRRQGPLDVGLACDYVRQAAEGLQCAHRLGMVHRDVKPANLLVRSAGPGRAPGPLKISDFGLVRLQTPESSAGQGSHPGTILVRENTVMGTPDFLSPEQARDLHRVDIRSDLYSLGCSFYYLLTGGVPFSGGKPVAKIIRHATEPPVPVDRHRPEVPRAVAEIVHRLMAKCPEERFQTPTELARALEPHAVNSTPAQPRSRPPALPILAGPPDRESSALDVPRRAEGKRKSSWERALSWLRRKNAGQG
jgi:serine/threonine protein kinase